MYTQSVSCNCYNCTFNINLAPIDVDIIFERKEANNSQDVEKCLINLSKQTLSPELVQLMGKGLTFIPKPKRNRTIQFIQQIDDFCRKLRLKYVFRYSDRAQPNLYRKSGYDPGPTDCRVVEQLTTTVKRILLPLVNKFDPKKDNLPFKIRNSLHYIARTRNLIIRKADKGSVVVVEDIDDYVKNGRQHLADNSVYLRVEGDISQALASSIKLKLKALINAGLLNNEQFKFCMPTR